MRKLLRQVAAVVVDVVVLDRNNMLMDVMFLLSPSREKGDVSPTLICVYNTSPYECPFNVYYKNAFLFASLKCSETKLMALFLSPYKNQ